MSKNVVDLLQAFDFLWSLACVVLVVVDLLHIQCRFVDHFFQRSLHNKPTANQTNATQLTQ